MGWIFFGLNLCFWFKFSLGTSGYLMGGHIRCDFKNNKSSGAYFGYLFGPPVFNRTGPMNSGLCLRVSGCL